MTPPSYASSVFLNCPFDEAYRGLREAIVFAVYACGFSPRCSLEESDSGNVRMEKIMGIIAQCKFGIHDISRTELDEHNGLPRFNMPLELGIFLGAKRFGDNGQRQKNCLVMDKERYRFQQFISDIAGQDIRSHNGRPDLAVGEVRAWLNDASQRATIPGQQHIMRRYAAFRSALPAMCRKARLEPDEMTYTDYSWFVARWLFEQAPDSTP